jgi:hypothetical protein
MTGPSQLTIDGRDVPRTPAQPPNPPPFAAAPLFTAPQTIPGQLAMPTDTRTR